MNNELQMPEWVEVGQTVWVVHTGSSFWHVATYSKMEIDKVTKTQVVVGSDRTEYKGGEAVGTVRYTRRFKLDSSYRNTPVLREMGSSSKYDRDDLVPDGCKQVLDHFHRKEVDKLDSEIRSVLSERAEDKHLSTDKLHTLVDRLQSFIRLRSEMDTVQSGIDDMSDGDFKRG
jgi:hypothetical protein